MNPKEIVIGDAGLYYTYASNRNEVSILCYLGWRCSPVNGAQTHYPLRMEWDSDGVLAAISMTQEQIDMADNALQPD